MAIIANFIVELGGFWFLPPPPPIRNHGESGRGSPRIPPKSRGTVVVTRVVTMISEKKDTVWSARRRWRLESIRTSSFALDFTVWLYRIDLLPSLQLLRTFSAAGDQIFSAINPKYYNIYSLNFYHSRCELPFKFEDQCSVLKICADTDEEEMFSLQQFGENGRQSPVQDCVPQCGGTVIHGLSRSVFHWISISWVLSRSHFLRSAWSNRNLADYLAKLISRHRGST